MMNNGNNMMGMGRGAGGMMIPGQGIPQMGVPGMSNAMAANMQAQQMMQQEQLQNSNSQQVMELILRKLQQEPPRPGGWWRGVGFSERVQNTTKIFLAFHRMLGIDQASALKEAQAFESQQFNVSAMKQQYDTAIKNKLVHIQMQAQQRGAAPGLMQSLPGALNMMMPAANPAPNQAFNPNMMNPNLQPTMLPGGLMAQQPQPQPGQLPAGMMPNNVMPNAMQIAQAQAQARANGVPMQSQVMFTPQEQQQIFQMAERLYNGMSPSDKEAAKTKLTPQELMALQTRNEDPALLLCRRTAIIRYREMKQNQQMGQQMGIPGVQFGGIGGVGGMITGQPHGLPNNQNGPQIGARPPQALPGAFGGKFEDILGQQAKAIQEEQQGRPVVPASQQRPGPPGMGLPQNVQQHNNPALQQALNNHRLMQNRLPQGSVQMPGSSAQGISMGQPTPQPSPAPPLNRGPSQTPRSDNPNQQPQQVRGPPQTMQGPRVSQPPLQNQQHPGQPGQMPQNQMPPQAIANMHKTLSSMGMPEAAQMKLAQLPPAEQAQVMARLRANAQQQMNLRNAQAAAAAAPGQQVKMNQQPTTAPKPAQPAATQQLVQTPAVSQPPMHNLGIRPGIGGQRGMTPQEKAMMDLRQFLPRVLQLDFVKQRINTDQVKTWGQLKAWLAQQNPPQEVVNEILTLQEKEFVFMRMKAQQAQQEKLRQQQQQQQPIQTTQPSQPAISTVQSPQRQVQPPQQQQKPAQVNPMLPQASLPAASQSDTKATEGRMPQPKQPHNPEQVQRFFLNLPDQLTPEMIQQLKTKSLIFRDKSDNDIRAIVEIQKRKARQLQLVQQQQQQQHLKNLQNGQTSGAASNQMPQRPQAQNQVPEAQVTGASSGQSLAQVKQEQAVIEARRIAAQNASKAGPEPQRTAGIQSTAPNQGGQPAQPTQPQQNTILSAGDNAKLRRFQQLALEAKQAYRPGPVQNMTPQNMIRMRAVLALLQPSLPMLIMRQLFYYFAHVDPGNEGPLKQFFMSRTILVEQFQDEKCTVLKEQFTIPLENAERILEAFKTLSGRVKQHEMRVKAANVMTQSTASPAAPAAQSAPPTRPADIKTMPAKTKAERPPDAPTSETPPNSFHVGPSPPQQRAPHGVPTYANMNELTPDRLVLPEDRKRKLNNNNTPVPAKTQSPPQVSKPVPQPAPTPKPEPAFRCLHTGCEFYRRSFPTGELLARHMEDAHKEKEPEDGLQFVLEMARNAFNLDINGKAIRNTKMEKTASAQTMKKSASTQSQILKVEGSVSMSRGTTQTSNLGVPRTPQSMGRSWDKSATNKPEADKAPLTPDSWIDCPVTPTELASLFPAPEAVQGTLDLSGLTPASTLASSKSERNTPNSDVVDNVAVVSDDTENRIPLSFSNDILGISEDTSFMDDEILDLDWEEAFGSSKKRRIDTSGGFNPDLFEFSFPEAEDIF